MKRTYKLDDASYEKFKSATKEEVNTLLSNVYTYGYDDCLMENKFEEKFTYKIACQVTDKLRKEKIKGVGKATIEKISAVIESYTGKI